MGRGHRQITFEPLENRRYLSGSAATDLLVQYTYTRDATLDGSVQVTDLGALATNWQTSGAWMAGDFNFDGSVGVTDLGALATNWQQGVGNPLGSFVGLPEPRPALKHVY